MDSESILRFRMTEARLDCVSLEGELGSMLCLVFGAEWLKWES